MILHTVNKSPFEKNSLETCLRVSAPGASILLIEDGVYGATRATAVADSVSAAIADRSVYVLGPDLKARGVTADSLIDGISVVDYAGFVKLAADNDKVQSWL